jgi:Glycosyl hydrolase family 99
MAQTVTASRGRSFFECADHLLRLKMLRSRWLVVFAVTLSCATLLIPVSSALALPRADPNQRLVMALYYPWYDENTWASGTTADQPMIPYASWERETIARQVGWARDASIDAFVSAWFGPRDKNPTETNFKTLLEVARPSGLKAALLVETDSGQFFPTRASLVEGLKYALSTHVNDPSYLKMGGKPVIFVWRPSSVFGPGGARVNQKGQATVAAWRAILDEVDPTRKALWIGEGDDFSILDIFAGIFSYSIAWAGDPAGQLASYARRVGAYNQSNGTAKLWIGTAMPGYDDAHIPGRGNAFAVDRADGGYYQRTFEGAVASGADGVMITSFNEWLEGHQIEPSASYARAIST